MAWTIAKEENTNYLCHHGIKGQKWGIRRFQNEDGTLTAEGRERYGLNGLKEMGPYIQSTRFGIGGLFRKEPTEKDKITAYHYYSSNIDKEIKEIENELYKELLPEKERLKMSKEEIKEKEDQIHKMSYKAEQEGKAYLKKLFDIKE